MIPTPSNPSRPWWSRSSILLKSSSSNKQQSPNQGNRLSGSKKFNTIASVIGLKPKKVTTPVEEPPSPVLPLHTGDIDAPPRPAKAALKPVSVAVGWADPREVQPDDFVDSCQQSVFSTDIDPFAAPGFPDGSLNVPESLRFSTLSDVSTYESHVRRDASYAHNRMSFASSSSLSHHRSDVTSDFSPVSSPLLSPATSGRHLSRLTVESDRVLPREPYLPSPVSPQSTRSGWDEGCCIVTSPSSVTLTETMSAPPRPKTRPRGFTDVGPSTISGLDYSTSDHKLISGCSPYNHSPRVVVRQPSSTRLHSLRPPTAPPAIELPPAPESARREDFSLLPAFPEQATHSAASSSSSLSFASSTSSKFDTMVPEGHRRDVRRLKDSKKSTKSRPSSPSKDRDVQDPPFKVPTSRREFSPTRTLKKAISIQNIPKRSQGNSAPSPTLPTAEDTKPLKKQRSFHHTRILMAPFPGSLKQANSSSISPGRETFSVPDEPSPKLPITPPVSNPLRVRERLFSGSSSRRHASPQSPGPDDETRSIFSLPSATSLHTRPHTAPVNPSSVSNKPDVSSFWDEEALNSSPATGNESQDYGPQQILSAADILKIENMVRDGENLSEFVRSRENSITSAMASKLSRRTALESATTGGPLSPPPVTRHLDSFQATNGGSGRLRTRGNSLQGKVGDSTNGHPQAIVSPSPVIAPRALSFQSPNALPGLPVPPRLRIRPSTSSGLSSPLAESTLAPALGAGDRSSVILHPLSPPPMRRSAARRILEPPSPSSAPPKPAISRRPSFLDMRDDADRELSPPEDSFLDMGKASLDTVRSSMEEENSGLS
ncbi:hypothetical protein EDB92DRAFT_1411313 [Lactarius akahatsu]|uniref:Uncharacterized protein n=1 Tax=Lactarius akahatsu TaxID=416441 RepID=A0AAD4LNJ5_9AGAM|nr:hypothetical protein EDB92DRAFT_1411313 [Lactarius akahatsu]